MAEDIEAILFDMGGTLRRIIIHQPAEKIERIKKIMELVGSEITPDEFARRLTLRAAAYLRWAKQNPAEIGESDLWTRWMLPDFPADRIGVLAIQLDQIWRDAQGPYTAMPETQETILTLYRRGYRLGLVSNTTRSVEMPRILSELGISGCFDTVVLSSEVGNRKPNPTIFLEAAAQMGIQPERCAYIGDRPDWDVPSARLAGYKRVVILRDPRKAASLPTDPLQGPDDFIDDLKELLTIFPSPRIKQSRSAGIPRYDISLSTMWGMKQFPAFADFFLAAPRLGFASIELNHQVSPAMLEGIELNGIQVSSIHEPCPAVIPAKVMRKQDLLISSTDEERRREGVNSIKHSIDLAKELHSRVIVVHAGQVQSDWSCEGELHALFEEDLSESPEYEELKSRYMDQRAALIGPHLAAVKKSLVELLDYAGHVNIRLGIENRYHFYDIPTLEEMAEILELADPDRLGFIYDVGHAQSQDRLGFYPHVAWLEHYAGRIIGAHLHDVIGIHDHRAPGMGQVDFQMVAAYLPKDAFRTLEVMSFNTPEQIRTGLEILVDTGCVNRMQ